MLTATSISPPEGSGGRYRAFPDPCYHGTPLLESIHAFHIAVAPVDRCRPFRDAVSMTIFQILLLAFVQGAAELLPVSSSAHVIMAEKLMGLDPTRPEMTLLLVMLHTGTMFAV